MKLNIATTLIALCLALPVASSGAVAAQEEGDCIQGRQIQEAISDGLIMELAQALQLAGIDGKPLSEPEVCRFGGEMQYRVNIMNANGEAERVVLNAEAN
jgi:hypothetical protein